MYACGMDKTQYRIAETVFPRLQAEIAELNKKANKLGVQPIVLNIDSTETIKVTDPDTRIKYDKVFYFVSFTGETPKLAGWRLIAVVEPLETGENLVKIVPNEACPQVFRTTDTHCDHCESRRQRKEVFVLGHDDGRFNQVGRNCIGDFLGGKSPDSILRCAEWGFEIDQLLREASDEEGWCGNRTPDTWNLDLFLQATAICVRKLGWLSRTKAREFDGAPATVANVLDLLCPPRNASALADWKKWVESNDLHVEDRDVELATAAATWAAALPTDAGDYLYNLGVATRREFVTRDTAGLVASVISAYQRHMDRQAELYTVREKKVREHVGVVGKRQGFEKLTVKSMRGFDSEYGVRTLVRFENETGSILIWWASGDPDWLEVDDVLDITATVKEHGDYKGIPQTIVQRVKEGLPKVKSRKKGDSVKPSFEVVVTDPISDNMEILLCVEGWRMHQLPTFSTGFEEKWSRVYDTEEQAHEAYDHDSINWETSIKH